MTPTPEQVDTALAYVDYHLGDSKRHEVLFRSPHGRPSIGAKLMGKTEHETLPHRAMIILAAEVQHLRRTLLTLSGN
jgi:hypothetical protein